MRSFLLFAVLAGWASGSTVAADPDEKLAPLIKDLQGKDVKAKLGAVAKLEAMGADAFEAAPALVEHGVLSPNPKIRDAAIAAFEKIDPAVHKEVVTILVDQSIANRNRSVESHKTLGPKAAAALPVIKVYHANLYQGLRQSGGKLVVQPAKVPRHSYHTLRAMVAIAPEDAATQTTVLALVGGADELLPRDPTAGVVERSQVFTLMNAMKIENKQKYTALVAGLAASRTDRPAIIAEIGKLGADAKGAIPTLQQLKTDKDAAVRAAAASALEAIRE
jgi:HEAT repeat protein